MHEASIAESLIGHVKRNVPRAHRVTRVHIEAGALQSLDPQAMQWAWAAVTSGTDLAGSQLECVLLPYAMTCNRCGREWASADAFEPCACGGEAACAGTSELRMISIEVEPAFAAHEIVGA